MNKIYDFSELRNIRLRERRLVLSYLLYALGFAAVLILLSVFIKNNLLLTLIFFAVMLCFLLFSVCFWRIKYGILEGYRSFLDDIETGRADEYIGVFEGKTEAMRDGEWFDVYDFTSSEGSTSFLVHRQKKIGFVEGIRYHLACVGKYILEWERTD